MNRTAKPAIGLLGLAVVALLLSSCYAMSIRPTGTISLNIGGTASRGMAGTSSDKVRVYLYTYTTSTGKATLFHFPTNNNLPYIEASYPGTVTVPSVPVGLWKVLISIGTDGPAGTEAFSTNAYGQSNVFNLTSAGASVTITTQASPFVDSPQLLGKNLNSVAFDYSYGVETDFPALFASSTNALYAIIPSLTTPDLSTDVPASIALPSGLQINSLAEGIISYSSTSTSAWGLYVNSNQGIVPYYYGANGIAFYPSYSSALTDTAGNRINVLGATALTDSSTGVAVYYWRAGGFGGVYLNSSNPLPFDTSKGGGATWVDIGLSGASDGNTVYAVAPNLYLGSTYAYFATAAGAFRTDPTLITTGQSNTGNLSNVVYFTAPNDETIQALAVDGVDNVIYIGTPNGAYYATLNESSSTSVISGSWTPIQATIGDDIVSIKVDHSTGDTESPHAGNGLSEGVALRSPYNIYVSGTPLNLGGSVTTFPFYAGLPGEVHSMDWAYGALFIAGSWGLTSLPTVPSVPLA